MMIVDLYSKYFFIKSTCFIVLDAARWVLGVTYDEFDALALSAAPGAGGLVHVPYLEGERTPNLPGATGELTGMTLANLTPANFARAAVEGLLCLMGACLDAVRAQDVRDRKAHV